MARTEEELRRIYEHSSGYCHLCGKKLAFKNYGVPGARGAWEVEHSKAKAVGGTDHGNNLYPAHISCNRKKQEGTARAARSENGLSKPPMSAEKRKQAKAGNAFAGGVVGALAGLLLAGPVGGLVGALAGASVGHKQNPDWV